MPKRSKVKYTQPTQLVPAPLVGPGFRGLNSELPTTFGSDGLWAAQLENWVWESQGEISQRKGTVDITTSKMTGTPIVGALWEYSQTNGATQLIGFTADKVFASTDDGATWTDITGSLSMVNGQRWMGVSFNDYFYMTGPGHRIWVYTGTGNMTEIATSPVTLGSILAAYGRMWAAVDGTSEIKYSALLDGSDWTGTDTGTLDLVNAWTDNTDTITHIVAWGASFVIFGKRHVLIYIDGSGSVVGIDPTQMYIVDTVEGSGALYRDAITKVGEGDIWYLSAFGVQSVRRALVDKSNPIGAVGQNVRSLTQSFIASHVGSDYEVKAIHSAKNGFVYFHFPESDGGLVFDSRAPLDESGAYRAATWAGLSYVYSVCVRVDNTILFALDKGNVAQYDTYADYVTGGTTTIPACVYASLWLDGQQIRNFIKVLKEAKIILYGFGTITGTVRWGVDYRPLEFSSSLSSTYTSSGGEWGSGEWNVDEYGAGLRARTDFVGLSNEGQFVKLYLTVTNPSSTKRMALRELVVYLKPGRVA